MSLEIKSLLFTPHTYVVQHPLHLSPEQAPALTSLFMIITAWLKWWCSIVFCVPYSSAIADPVLTKTRVHFATLPGTTASQQQQVVKQQTKSAYVLTLLETSCLFPGDPGRGKGPPQTLRVLLFLEKYPSYRSSVAKVWREWIDQTFFQRTFLTEDDYLPSILRTWLELHWTHAANYGTVRLGSCVVLLAGTGRLSKSRTKRYSVTHFYQLLLCQG